MISAFLFVFGLVFWAVGLVVALFDGMAGGLFVLNGTALYCASLIQAHTSKKTRP